MERRSWRKWWVTLGVLLLMARAAIAAPAISDLEERVLQAIARHADREAANLLIETWQQEAEGAVSPGSVALNEGLKGHYLTAKQLLARVVADNSDDATVRLGSLVLILLEGNPPAGRKAIEDMAAQYPENPHLQRRYSDVLESMGLPSQPLPRVEAPAEPAAPEPDTAPVATVVAPTPAPEVPKPAPSAAPQEIRPVQGESVREQLLRQLAEAQARQAREEAERLRKAREEQARKRREEAARVAAEKKRREEAARQAADQKRRQDQARVEAQRMKAEQARLANEKRQAEARTAAARKLEEQKKAAQARQAEQTKLAQARQVEQAKQAKEQARLAAERQKRLERAEQERWLAARRSQPTPAPTQPTEPVIPTPPPVEASTYVLKPVKIANRRVWIGEERSSVHGRLGRPRSVEGGGLERYAGLSIWYDRQGKVATFEVDSAWFHGPGGVRPGLTLREVLKALPNSDGLFHLRADGPDATSSLYVLSTVDGTLAELQFNDEVWLSTHVRTTTPAGATHLYEDLLKKGPVRRLAPDYVFALEARRKPLP